MPNTTTYRQVADVQGGAVSRDQLRSLGLDRRAVDRRVRSGELEQRSPNVFPVVGSADTTALRCWTAVLDADGVISHASALGLFGVPGFPVEPIEVTRLRGGRRRSSHLARVHEPRLLLPHHLTELDGIPVTTPVRALFDIAGTERPQRVERALDTAWAMRLVTHPLLVSTLQDLAKRGRPGVALMRSLIAERAGHRRPVESGLEGRLEYLARRAGIGGFVRQVDTGGEDTWLGRVDFRHRELPIVVFVDSERYHSALLDVRRDEAQRRALEDAGFVVVRVTDVDLWSRPEVVVAALHRACMQARHHELADQTS